MRDIERFYPILSDFALYAESITESYLIIATFIGAVGKTAQSYIHAQILDVCA